LDLFSKSGIAIGGGKNPPVKNKKELRLQISLKIIKPARNLKRKKLTNIYKSPHKKLTKNFQHAEYQQFKFSQYYYIQKN